MGKRREPKLSVTAIKHQLQDAINQLMALGCTFEYCPGPNKPFVHMATCRNCAIIKDLRKLRDSI